MKITTRLSGQLSAGVTATTLLALACAVVSGGSAQSASPVPQPTAKAVAPTAVTPDNPVKAVRLPPLAARPNSIIGRAVFENGQPIPKFQVTWAGLTGRFQTAGVNGQYAVTGTGQYAVGGTGDLLVTRVYATVQFHFDDMNWLLPAWPTDNIADGSGAPASSDLYRGHTGKGIVRDFVLKMSGIKNGYDPVMCPDHCTHANPTPSYAYYGGGILIGSGADNTGNPRPARPNIMQVYPAGSIVTVTLKPTGSRVDGLPASTITRSCPLDINFNLYGIPYAIYTATATLKEPGGAVHNLKLGERVASDPLGEPVWGSSCLIKWRPWQDFPTGSAIRGPEISVAAE